MHPNANTTNEDELNSFFSGSSTTGSITIDRMVMTFKALCDNADFNGISTEQNNDTDISITIPQPIVAPSNTHGNSPIGSPTINTGSLTPIININIELSLPDTKDSEVYDNFFAAMRKHLFR